MGTLYLVRHAQASFGADDYDCLSALGHRQAERLGEHFRLKGLQFDAVLVGTLRRHRETLAGIAQGLQAPAMPQALSWPGLDEYDSGALVRAVHPEPLARPDTPELVRHHFRLLRQGLQQWMAGATNPAGMTSHAEFVAGVKGALDHVREHHIQQKVLLVSSGGPISTAVGLVLGLQPEATVELNLRIRNSSVTEFEFTPKRHLLLSYNALPHLEHPDHASWITYA